MTSPQTGTANVDLTGLSVRISTLENKGQNIWSGVVLPVRGGVLPIQLNGTVHPEPWPGAGILVHGQKGGMLFDFSGEVKEFVTDPAPLLLLPVPQSVETRSLRRFDRAPLDVAAQCRWYGTASSEPNQPQDARIVDIGKGGAAIAIKEVPDDDRLLELELTIPGDFRVGAECVRRYAAATGTGDFPFRVGLEFIMISAQERKAVSLFVTSASNPKGGDKPVGSAN